MISVPPRPFCHRVSTRSSGDRLPWCPSRTPRRTVPSDSNLVSIPVLSRLVRKRSTPLPTPRTRRIEQRVSVCVPGTSPKHVWASYSRPDAHRGPRTLEIVAPTQIQWQNHVTTQPRRHQRLHCHTHEGGRGHSGLQNTLGTRPQRPPWAAARGETALSESAYRFSSRSRQHELRNPKLLGESRMSTIF